MNKKYMKLADCCISISDGDHQAPPKQNDGVPFITISNLVNDEINFEGVMYVSEEYYQDLPEMKKAQKGDILYSVVGSFGIPIIISDNKKFVFQRHIAILRANKDIVYPEYLYYIMKNPDFYRVADRYAIGAAQRTISLESLRNMEVCICSKEEQKKIVDELRNIDKKIEVNRSINDNLEQQAKLLYNYWFNQFDFLDENGKPYRSSGGKMLWNEQLKRDIPLKWSVSSVTNLLTIVTGKEDANFSTENGKYKFFTCSNSTLQCDSYAFEGKAILIAGNGDFNVKHYHGKFNAYQRTYVLIPSNDLYYAPIYFVASSMIEQFKSGSNGSIVKFITKGDIENIKILLPDNDIYYQQLNNILTQIEANQLENETLVQLRDWLLPMLMNGQATIED